MGSIPTYKLTSRRKNLTKNQTMETPSPNMRGHKRGHAYGGRGGHGRHGPHHRRHRGMPQDPNTLTIPVRRFTPSQVKISLDKATGVMTINAESSKVEKTNRPNGERKSFFKMEETLTLPKYLVENNLIDQVKTRFETNGMLSVILPEDPAPKNVTEKEEIVTEPVEMDIQIN